MARGDHLYVRKRRPYSHHGIDCGDGQVIHYVGTWSTGRRIERTSLDDFLAGGPLSVRRHPDGLPVEDVVRLAESRLGEGGYHLIRNNCEHFANWASTGQARSRQVRRWLVTGPGTMASLVAADAGGIHLMLLSGLGMGVYAATKPIRRRQVARDR